MSGLACMNGLLLWDATPGVILNGTVTVNQTGKCNECGKFPVWCWGCGNKKALEIAHDWQYLSTMVLANINEGDDENEYSSQGNYLIVISGGGRNEVIDRRQM